MKRTRYSVPSIMTVVALGVTFLCVTMGGYSSASGQGLRSLPPSKSVDQVVEEMGSRLNLTEEQKVRLRPILEEQRAKRTAIAEQYRDQGRGALVYMQDDMEDLEMETRLKLTRVLTEGQMEEYREMEAEERARIKEVKSRRGRRGSGGRKGF